MECLVPLPRNEVFDLWTTSEGVTRFLRVPSSVKLEVGGPMEVYFMRELGVEEGIQGSEGCQVLSWVDDELLVFSWNAPPSMPKARTERTWVVLRFDDADGATRVRLTHTGFGPEPYWDEVVDYFSKAWAQVLSLLTKVSDTPVG